ncbi:MAG: glycoside hydrolase family 31 protein [Pseudomonadota bacterium]
MLHTLFTTDGDALVARLNGETLRLEAVGRDAVRVRATRNAKLDQALPSALLDGVGRAGTVEIAEDEASLTHGDVRLTLRHGPGGIAPALHLSAVSVATGKTLLAGEAPHVLWPQARHYLAEGGGLWRTETRFAARAGERFYGLGQQQHGSLDHKGCTVDLVQKNTQVSIPFVLSSEGYGLLWNNPGLGRVELSANRTLWAMEATPQIDFVVIGAGTPRDIVERYTELTGRPPALPDWAYGFWQCKLRYETQDQLMEVARTHKAKGLPLDVLVIDFFHWTAMGEWRFDPTEWPDPDGMVAELREMGIEPMVSVWPTVNANAETYDGMREAGWLVGSKRGAMDGSIFYDRRPDGRNALLFYDATHPDARAFHWERVRSGYADHGFKAFWLDANEPETYPHHPDNMLFHEGDGRAVANVYPLRHLEGYGEAMAREGVDGLLLSRSAWAGAQRVPAVVWSGDVHSTFADLRIQLAAGLNMGLSGIAWWTTDIGGFKGGDVNDPAFHELLIRWFQWGTFCPVMRLHGFRQDAARDPELGHAFSAGGADNEVWSFGPEVEAILTDYIHLRERLRPYVRHLAEQASATGLPLLRAFLLDFPDDPEAWAVQDAYLFGPDLLVAPVMDAGASERAVYLPAGATWTEAWTGARHEGGQTVTAEASLARIPLFLRDGATLPIRPE